MATLTITGEEGLEEWVYAIGGQHFDDIRTVFRQSVEQYNINQGWQYAAPMISPRSLFTTTVVKDHIYAIGGFCDQGILSTPAIEFYSPKSNNWSALVIDSIIPRTSHGSVCGKNNKLIIFGGEGVDGAIKTCHLIDVTAQTAEEI